MNVFATAKALLESYGWRRGAPLGPGDKICLGMAIEMASEGGDATYSELARETVRKVKDVLPRCEHNNNSIIHWNDRSNSIIHWNDRHATEADVYALLDRLIAEEE